MEEGTKADDWMRQERSSASWVRRVAVDLAVEMARVAGSAG